jgi:hypothetical protein
MNSRAVKSSAVLMLVLWLPAGCLAAAAADSKADPQPADASPRELSVAPLDHIEYPESRPAWVSDAVETDPGSFRMVVISGPSDSVEESLEELRVMQRAAVATLVSQMVNSDGRADFYSPSDEEIGQNLVVRQYAGEVKQGDQTRYEHAAEIMFSEALEQEVRRAWQNVEVRRRLGALGVSGVIGLSLLSCGSAVTSMISRRKQRRNHADAPSV